MSTQEQLQRIALAEFASAGYAGTSIQRIAELAGLSKSSVLYHFTSKEALLEAAIGPAIDRLESLTTELEVHGVLADYRQTFLEEFVDFLFACRHEVHLFINQGAALHNVPSVERANNTVRRLADFFAATTTNPHDTLRFGIALGGSAYLLSTADNLGQPLEADQDTRSALIAIMSELLAPVRSN